MPSPLEILQRRFTASIVGEVDEAFVSDVSGGGALSAAEAVEVYRDGYVARLSEALGETFEACWRVLGDEDFLTACRDYVRSTPSTTHNLSDYGADFHDFLLHRFKTQAPFIGDLARLEWAFKELFHAPSQVGLSPEALAAGAKSDSVLCFGSALVLFSSVHRVHALWKRDRADETPLSTADWSGEERLILYKSGGSAVFTRLLSAPEFSALSLLRDGRQLGDALAETENLDENSAHHLFAFVSEARLVMDVTHPVP